MRTFPFFPLPRAAALAAGLALVVSTVITAPAAQAVSPQAPPVTDTCYDYRSSNSEDETAVAVPVPCEGEHSAQTFYTRSLPEGFGVPAKAGAKKRLKVAKPCTTDAMNAYLGLSDATIPSRFQIVTVFPTAGQWNAGERWMRCDVVLRGGKDFTRFSGGAPQLVASTPRGPRGCGVGRQGANEQIVVTPLHAKVRSVARTTQVASQADHLVGSLGPAGVDDDVRCAHAGHRRHSAARGRPCTQNANPLETVDTDIAKRGTNAGDVGVGGPPR